MCFSRKSQFFSLATRMDYKHQKCYASVHLRYAVSETERDLVW